jgi:ATP-dependent Clp protease ATP-binding subunit ClpC
VQLLLQVLEDGRLTDSLGRTVDFRNTILIMTSNIGAELLQRPSSMGFDAGMSYSADYDKSRDRILEETKKHFKPEFINRINQIVVFHPLTKDHMKKVVELELSKVSKRLASQKIEIEVVDSAKEFLLEKGWDEKYGARPLRRAVENYLEDPLAEAILRGEVRRGEPIRVTFSGGEALKFEQNTPVA